MNLTHYEVGWNRAKNRYWFVSKGNSQIIKIVEFQKLPDANRYNLVLADYAGGRVSYSSVSNNRDIDIVMASVGYIINNYTSTYPKREIYVTGDTEIKTRLYRKYVSVNLLDILKHYHVWGQLEKTLQFEAFEKGKNYTGFLVKRIQQP